MQYYPNDDPVTAAKKLSKETQWFPIPEKEGNGKGKTTNYVQKRSEGDHLLAESIIIGNDAYFAVAQSTNDKTTIRLEKEIPLTETCVYKPYEKQGYLNRPYSFKSEQDFWRCIENARTESLDTLYQKVKRIWNKYIDADDFHISICAADTIFTYYQDKIGLTHYLFFVGNNGSGKSNNLLVLKFLAYRNFTSTDMTAPNIYQFLGSDEEGQGTLCEDEADRIEEDRQKMAIHKNGSMTGFPVARTDNSNGRKQLKYNTFCWKAFAAEKFPDSFKAKGFNQRVLELQCSSGDPKEDISEVANPAGEEEFQHLLDELEQTRNLLLAYRLLHYHDKIPDIKLNIKGREKQLFKPVLRIFQNTDTLNKLLPVVSNYVAQKREANFSTLHAFLYRVIKDLVSDRNTTQLESGFIWDYIKSNLHGEDIPGSVLSCETPEFGVISQKEITQTLQHIFGAKIKRVSGKRMLSFDTTKLQRLGKVYDLDIEIKVLREEEECSTILSVPDVSDLTDVGDDTDINEPEKTPDTGISEHESQTNVDNLHSNNKESDLVDPPHPTQPTQPTLNERENTDPEVEMTKAEQRAKYEEAQAESLRKSKAAQGKEKKVSNDNTS